MRFLLYVCAVVASTTALADQVSDVMAARVDAQARRVDRLTMRVQSIYDRAYAARAASKAGGDIARHLLNTHLSGKTSIYVMLSCTIKLIMQQVNHGCVHVYIPTCTK